MRLELTGRHVEITPALRRLVDAKLVKLDRLLNASAVSAQAVLTLEKNRRRADITVHTRGEKFLHGDGASNSWAASVGEAIDKISQQALKIKGKWQGRKRRGGGKAAPAGGLDVREAGAGREGMEPAGARRPLERVRMPRILRASRQAVRDMSVAEATREVDANGEGVVVFRDTETDAISVLYRRPGGELTLVQTET
jgi:putative sigma-54 modulation protein